MPKDITTQAPNDVRRKDRAVNDDAWIEQFLHTAHVGVLATVYDDQPFMNSNLFVYDSERRCIYTHTARFGRTQANIDAGQATAQKVCFSVMEMGRMLPADEALEFSVEYAGVVVFGTADVVEDEAEAIDALQMLLDKYAPHLKASEDYRPPVSEEVKRTAVFRIHIDSWSGKKKEVEADFPGAFWLAQQPILASNQAR